MYKIRVLEIYVNISKELIIYDLVYKYDFKNILCFEYINAIKIDNKRRRFSYRFDLLLSSQYLKFFYRASTRLALFDFAYCDLYIISIERVNRRNKRQTKARLKYFVVKANCVRRTKCNKSSTT